MSEKKSIGECIRAFRTDHDLSQDRLAELIFRSRKLVNRWENGQSIPSAQDIKNLADVFHESADVFIFGRHEKNRTVIDELGISDNAISRLKFFKENSETVPLDFYSRIICEWYSFYTLAQLISGAKEIQEDSTYVKFTVKSLNQSENPVASAFACQLEKDTLKLNRLEAYEYARTLVDYLIDGGGKPHGKA